MSARQGGALYRVETPRDSHPSSLRDLHPDLGFLTAGQGPKAWRAPTARIVAVECDDMVPTDEIRESLARQLAVNLGPRRAREIVETLYGARSGGPSVEETADEPP